MTLKNDDIDRMRGSSWIARAALTGATIVAGATIAVILTLGYADAERDRELRQWQVRLGMIADTRTSSIERWLRDQFGALGALADSSPD